MSTVYRAFLFNLYPYRSHFWTDSMNEIIHISAESCFIVTNSKVNRSRQNYPFTEEILVFIKPDIFVSEWSKEGADSIYTPCIYQRLGLNNRFRQILVSSSFKFINRHLQGPHPLVRCKNVKKFLFFKNPLVFIEKGK